jgi:hypothetical protein
MTVASPHTGASGRSEDPDAATIFTPSVSIARSRGEFIEAEVMPQVEQSRPRTGRVRTLVAGRETRAARSRRARKHGGSDLDNARR